MHFLAQLYNYYILFKILSFIDFLQINSLSTSSSSLTVSLTLTPPKGFRSPLRIPHRCGPRRSPGLRLFGKGSGAATPIALRRFPQFPRHPFSLSTQLVMLFFILFNIISSILYVDNWTGHANYKFFYFKLYSFHSLKNKLNAIHIKLLLAWSV